MKTSSLIHFCAACILGVSAVKQDSSGSDLSFLKADLESTLDASLQVTDASSVAGSDITSPNDDQSSSRLQGESTAEQVSDEKFLQDSPDQISGGVAQAASVKELQKSSPSTPAAEPTNVEQAITSTELFDLNTEEVAAVQAMEDELRHKEEQIMSVAVASGDSELINEAISEVATLEVVRAELTQEVEDIFIAEAEASDIQVVAPEELVVTQEPLVKEKIAFPEPVLEEFVNKIFDSSEIPEPVIDCESVVAAYTSQIDALQETLDQAETLTASMAESLAKIDPNMENADEGKSLLKKMYKKRQQKPVDAAFEMLATPAQCMDKIAGKVLVVEDLQDKINEAVSFRDFFADVYCQAYVNSLVTVRDDLSRISPGAFDSAIDEELLRMQESSEEQVNTDELESLAFQFFLIDIENGTLVLDETSLIEAVEPVAGAMTICGADVEEQVQNAMIDRENYLNDANFLTYLKNF